jgi:hypothetical protein
MAISNAKSRLPTDDLTIPIAVGLCLLVLGWAFLRAGRLSSENFDQPQSHVEHQATAMVDNLPASTSVPPPKTAVLPRSPITPIEVAEIRPSADPDPLSAGSASVQTRLAAPAPVNPIAAPRLPFAFIGRVHDDRGWTVLLVKNETKYIARQGDVLEGVWHIEAIDEEGIVFRHTLTGARERLALAAHGPDAPTTQITQIMRAEAVGSSRSSIRQYAPVSPASTQTSSDEIAVTVVPPPAFQRRLVSADIPREPWVCEASRANALLPCRNTWSMSEAQRVACRQAAEGSYKSCLGRAMAAPTEEE